MAPVILDLFCGAGGASRGYQDAGFRVVGVDHVKQPQYAPEFYVGDAVEWLRVMANGAPLACGPFDAIHASPPCQAYSRGTARYRNQGSHEYPDLIPIVRELLDEIGLPYVIENVEGAPLKDPVTLCGAMDVFPNLRVLRHRLFETNWPLPQPLHPAKHPLVMTHDKRKKHYKKLDEWTDYVGIYGGGQGQSAAASADAMGIDWMTRRSMAQAIPPAYTHLIGMHLMDYLDSQGKLEENPTKGDV